MVRRTLGRVARYGAPRTLAALQDVDRITGQVDQLTDRLLELERRLAAGDGEREQAQQRAAAVESELRDQVRRLEHELAESRRLALRVGQLTDLVFSRLAGVTVAP
jgi:predicted  nucleic acid-binding Zn-ribbon protein